jgi:hypothetical protein
VEEERMASGPDLAGLVAELSEEFQAWSAAHPEAGLLELEVALARRLRAVQGQVLSGVLAARSEPASRCPSCGGGPLRVRTEGERTVLATGDTPVSIRRPYLVCAACGQGHFPPGCAPGAAAE